MPVTDFYVAARLPLLAAKRVVVGMDPFIGIDPFVCSRVEVESSKRLFLILTTSIIAFREQKASKSHAGRTDPFQRLVMLVNNAYRNK